MKEDNKNLEKIIPKIIKAFKPYLEDENYSIDINLGDIFKYDSGMKSYKNYYRTSVDLIEFSQDLHFNDIKEEDYFNYFKDIIKEKITKDLIEKIFSDLCKDINIININIDGTPDNIEEYFEALLYYKRINMNSKSDDLIFYVPTLIYNLLRREYIKSNYYSEPTKGKNIRYLGIEVSEEPHLQDDCIILTQRDNILYNFELYNSKIRIHPDNIRFSYESKIGAEPIFFDKIVIIKCKEVYNLEDKNCGNNIEDKNYNELMEELLNSIYKR